MMDWLTCAAEGGETPKSQKSGVFSTTIIFFFFLLLLLLFYFLWDLGFSSGIREKQCRESMMSA